MSNDRGAMLLTVAALLPVGVLVVALMLVAVEHTIAERQLARATRFLAAAAVHARSEGDAQVLFDAAERLALPLRLSGLRLQHGADLLPGDDALPEASRGAPIAIELPAGIAAAAIMDDAGRIAQAVAGPP